MSFYLDGLFHEPDELCQDGQSLKFSEIASKTTESSALWVANADSDEVVAMAGEVAGLQAMIASLKTERDTFKAQVDDQKRTNENLDRSISKDFSNSVLPMDVVRRLNRLEVEVTRLQSENSQLKSDLQANAYRNFNLSNQNDRKSRKLKGANKKVKNAKEVAGNEEEKAKDAVGDKQRHLASERKMMKERNDALAALQEQRKMNADLRAELDVERSGVPHMRDTAEDYNNTVAVIPIEFDFRRVDFQVGNNGVESEPNEHRRQLPALVRGLAKTQERMEWAGWRKLRG